MLNFTADDSVTILVPFLVDSEYVVPDTGSVTFSLRDNNGSLVVTDQALTPTATEIAVTIPSQYNAKALPTELRTLIVKYTVGTAPYQVTVPYRLNAWLNIGVTPAEVRKHLGLSTTELPDADVDFYDAYYLLDAQLAGMGSPATMAAALSSGTLNAKYANDALIYKAAFDLLPSLPERLLRREQAGTMSSERFGNYDFGALHDQLTDLLEDTLTNITNIQSTFPPLLVVGRRLDIIKGPGTAVFPGTITGP